MSVPPISSSLRELAHSGSDRHSVVARANKGIHPLTSESCLPRWFGHTGHTDWAAYYDPLALRIAQLRQQRPATVPRLTSSGARSKCGRVHGRDYGNTGYVLRPR